MRAALCILLFAAINVYGQVTKDVRYFNGTGRIQDPTNFFPVNVLAGANISIDWNPVTKAITINGGAGGGTNVLVQTNGVNVGSVGTLNFIGATGAVNGVEVQIGGFGGSGTSAFSIMTNNVIVSATGIATNLNFVVGTNIVPVLATNSSGHVSIQFNLDWVATTNGLATISYADSKGLTTNANQFLGVPLSIREGVILSNVYIWPSNNLRTPLSVTNLAGSASSLVRMHNTNLTGMEINSNGATVFRASVTGTDPTVTFLNTNANQTYVYFSNNFGGFSGSAVMRTHAGASIPGTVAFSPVNAQGQLHYFFDGGDSTMLWGISGVGAQLSLIPSAAVYAFHGGTSRRFQITNVWDIWSRSNIFITHTSLANVAVGTNGIMWGKVGGAFQTLDTTNAANTTNIFRFSTTNWVAGQVLKAHNVENFPGGQVIIVLTNDVDNSVAGGGLTTNENQFLGVPLSIKNYPFITNLTGFASNRLEILIVSNASQLVYLPSNTVPIIGQLSMVTNAFKHYFYDTNYSLILSNLVASASSGDIVELGNGVFNIGTQTIRVPVGVRLVGQGIDKTIISGTVGLSTNYIVQIMSSNIIENMTISAGNRSAYLQNPLGASSLLGHTAVTNVALRRLKLDGETDAFILFNSTTTYGIMEDCELISKWDTFRLFGPGAATPPPHEWSIRRTRIISDVNGATEANTIANNKATPIKLQNSANAEFIDCEVIATNGLSSFCLFSSTADGTHTNKVIIAGGRWIAAGTNEAAKIDNSNTILGQEKVPVVVQGTSMSDADGYTDTIFSTPSVITFLPLQSTTFLSQSHKFTGGQITNRIAFLGGTTNLEFAPLGNGLVLSGGTLLITNIVTNVISLSTSNTTSKPITNSFVNGVLTLYGLEAGANIALSDNGSNIVITAAAGGGGALFNPNQFLPSSTHTNIKDGAVFTNIAFFSPESVHSRVVSFNTNTLVITNGFVGIGVDSPTVAVVISNSLGLGFIQIMEGGGQTTFFGPGDISVSQGNGDFDISFGSGGLGTKFSSNAVVPIASGVLDMGTPAFPWRNLSVSRQVRIGPSLSHGIIFEYTNAVINTNLFRFSITNPVAGQVFKFHNVENLSGGAVSVVVTNAADNSGGGGGLTTNANQFGASVVLTIKSDALLTNLILYAGSQSQTNLTINQHIGASGALLSVLGSNTAPIFQIESNGFLVFTNLLTNYSRGGTRSSPTNTIVKGVADFAGRLLPEWTGQMGLSDVPQPSLFNNRVFFLYTSSGTTIGTFGTAATTTGGTTVSHTTPDADESYMVNLASPSTSNGTATAFSTPALVVQGPHLGNIRGQNSGWFFASEWANTNNIAGIVGGGAPRTFVGLTGTSTPNLTNLVNTTNATGTYIGLYSDPKQSLDMYVSSRDSTAEFRTNTGINFVATNIYQYFMFQSPTSRMVNWKLRDLTARTEAAGWFSNNVPTNSAFRFGIATKNGTNRAHSIRFSKLYVEAPITPQ